MKPFKDYFSEDAPNYARYRPRYPVELVSFLADGAPGNEHALDCGCGTGQLSVMLADRFQQVTATDPSREQIEQGERHPRVRYRVALAEESGLPDHSLDVVTVAQAAHWLDLDSFYAEVRRVARPGAIIALITYGKLVVEGDVGNIIDRFYRETLHPYWPQERRLVENGYQHFAFPFAEVPFPRIPMEDAWSFDQLLGYIHTWSAVAKLKKTPVNKLLIEFEQELKNAWGSPDVKRSITWPLTGRIGYVNS